MLHFLSIDLYALHLYIQRKISHFVPLFTYNTTVNHSQPIDLNIDHVQVSFQTLWLTMVDSRNIVGLDLICYVLRYTLPAKHSKAIRSVVVKGKLLSQMCKPSCKKWLTVVNREV